MKKLNYNIMKALNEKEFKELIKKYESLTIEDFQDDYYSVYDQLKKITGFGSKQKCTLCKSIRDKKDSICDCQFCVYGIASGHRKTAFNECSMQYNESTYDAIYESKTPEEIITAVHNRAKHMKKVWKAYKAMQKDETVQK